MNGGHKLSTVKISRPNLGIWHLQQPWRRAELGARGALHALAQLRVCGFVFVGANGAPHVHQGFVLRHPRVDEQRPRQHASRVGLLVVREDGNSEERRFSHDLPRAHLSVEREGPPARAQLAVEVGIGRRIRVSPGFAPVLEPLRRHLLLYFSRVLAPLLDEECGSRARGHLHAREGVRVVDRRHEARAREGEMRDDVFSHAQPRRGREEVRRHRMWGGFVDQNRDFLGI